MKRTKRIGLAASACLMLALAWPASAQYNSPPPDNWTWRFALNGWFPSLDISTQFNLPGGGNINSSSDSSGLSNLKFAFMGTLEARRGLWTFLADVAYLNLGDVQSKVRSISGPTGSISIPIDTGTRTDLKGFVGTFEGGYALLRTQGATADLLGGLRYANLKAKVDWELSGPTGGLATSGGVEASRDYWDGVIGVRGRSDLGGNWDLRYYLDAGAGSSQFTWQAVVGVGYRFGWGDVAFGYRHLDYQFRNDRPLSDLKLSGPQIVLGFQF